MQYEQDPDCPDCIIIGPIRSRLHEMSLHMHRDPGHFTTPMSTTSVVLHRLQSFKSIMHSTSQYISH